MPDYFLGVDGGGSGCRARLTDRAGIVLGEGRGGPANPRIDLNGAMAAIIEAADAALAAAGLPGTTRARVHAGLGLAGVGQQREFERLLARPHPFAGRALATDAHVACLGAHGGGDGAVLVVGTGSCGHALTGGRRVRIGGWGFPVSDQGSGAWLGLEALRAALQAHDGLIDMPPLTAAVMARFDDDPEQVVAWLDEARPRDYAGLAPLVIDHAAAGDPLAVGLMRQAAADVAGMAGRLLGLGVPRLCLLGGLAPALAPWLPRDLRDRLSEPLGDALDGALMLARQSRER
ncbi:MAG: N-acetylglucosamine kinase [Alphaproteobacteria bacterium]|jgi:glucosamine kinase|nr:N-acetylglucosamine kinase [Alphaproteobacteria bacterium]